MVYEMDLANGKSDEIVATLVIEDVPPGTTDETLRNHYQRHARLFMRQFQEPRVIAIRRIY